MSHRSLSDVSDTVEQSAAKRARTESSELPATCLDFKFYVQSGELPMLALLPFLTDSDVLLTLLLLCKAMKTPLANYQVKGYVESECAREITCINRYTKVEVQNMLMTDTQNRWFPTLKDVYLSDDFDMPLHPGDIPSSVITLDLGKTFNQPLVIGSIRSSVKFLDLGSSFNQGLERGMIPKSVEVLVFGGFNKPLAPGVIPESVTSLHIGSKYEHALREGVIPSSVNQLFIYERKIKKSVIPTSVTRMCTGSLAVLQRVHQWIPSSVTSLRIEENDDSADKSIHPGWVPGSVQTLVHGQRIRKCAIPNSVTTMIFLPKFNKPLAAGTLPESLTTIRFGISFNQQLTPGVLPDSLKVLESNLAARLFAKKSRDSAIWKQI